MNRTAWYSHFTKWAARITGRPITFTLAVALIAAWMITGPIFHFSDTWQLVINTATTIVTFLMVKVTRASRLVYLAATNWHSLAMRPRGPAK